MARYFFLIRDDQGLIEDIEGTDLPDATAALASALESMRELLATAIKAGEEFSFQELVINDADGRVVNRVSVLEALPRVIADRIR